MKKRIFQIILLCTLCSTAIFSQNIEPLEIRRPAAKNYSPIIFPEKNISSRGNSTTEIAENYIKDNWKKFGHYASFENTIEHIQTTKMKSGDIVRFIQKFKGIDVYHSLITVKFSDSKTSTLSSMGLCQYYLTLTYCQKSRSMLHVKK